MPERDLRQKAEQLFKEAIAETSRSHALRSLHRELKLGRERLDQPMRVAIVGLIKAGKSTMMNAFLGETLVATGTIEATFNVNWLKYGAPPSLLVHFKDGCPPEKKSMEELERLTRRSEDNRAFLLSIKYIEVYYPGEILRTLNLIDTPGLASFYKDDEVNALEFLKLHGQELTMTTQQEAANADAVLYLFSHSLAESDTSLVELFQGPTRGQTSPINSIGVLTKADMFWPDLDHDDTLNEGNKDYAIDRGNEIIARLQDDHPQLRRLFYATLPVCGWLAWGAQTLDDEEFAILQQLAALPYATFRKIERNAERFVGRSYPDIPVSPEQRKRVFDRLGQYGVGHAYAILQTARGITRLGLSAVLLKRSGLPALKSLVLAHFGNRAYLIKLDAVLKRIEEVCFWARQRSDIQGSDRNILRKVEGVFGQLRDNEPGFNELGVLRDHYQGRLGFTDKEVQQLLQVTGEYGVSDRQRLGLQEITGTPTEVDLKETLQRARQHADYWRRRSIDPGANRETERAAEILGDAYDYISYHTLEQLKKLGHAL